MNKHWTNLIPWYLTIASTLVLVMLAVFLIENIEWFKSQAMTSKDWGEGRYNMSIFHLHLSMIKRSVGLFAGFALLFIGAGVSFFTVKAQMELNLEAQNISLGLVTASPGIVAMLLGTTLIYLTIQSKDHFEEYEQQKTKIYSPQSPLPEEDKK
jgi:cytochrome c biogenesis protein CcdA